MSLLRARRRHAPVVLLIAAAIALSCAFAADRADARNYNMNRWDLLPYPALGQAHNASEDSWTFDFYASTYYDRRVKFTKDNKHTTRVSYNLYWANDIYEVTEIPAHTPYSSYRFTHAHPDWMIADDVARVWGRNLGNNSMFGMTGQIWL